MPDDGQEVPDDGLYTHQNLFIRERYTYTYMYIDCVVLPTRSNAFIILLRLVEGFPKLALALLGTTAKTTPKLSTPPEVLVSGLLST